MRRKGDFFRIFEDFVTRKRPRRFTAADGEGVAGARRRERFEAQRRQNSRCSGIPRIWDYKRSGSCMDARNVLYFWSRVTCAACSSGAMTRSPRDIDAMLVPARHRNASRFRMKNLNEIQHHGIELSCTYEERWIIKRSSCWITSELEQELNSKVEYKLRQSEASNFQGQNVVKSGKALSRERT